jgi:ubiquinone/menaquinone biosynthesis C-methylase UbiE
MISLKIKCLACESIVDFPVNSTRKNCNCGFAINRLDGCIDLRSDKSFDTFLNIDTYDESHGVLGLESSKKLFNVYKSISQQLNCTAFSGDVLEIASGSGHLSLALAAYPSFSKICLSDISAGFMRKLLIKINEDLGMGQNSDKLFPALFDANNIPLDHNQFDIVLGNSVLHHFKCFEDTLKSVYAVLKNGGVAIFGEPVMDTYVLSSFIAGQIVSASSVVKHEFTTSELNIVEAISKRAAIKMDNLRSDRSNLENIEDKFVFPVSYMRELAKDIGFEKFNCVTPPINDFGLLIKKNIQRIFVQQSILLSKLDSFEFLFEPINTAYFNAYKENCFAPFSFFAFKK